MAGIFDKAIKNGVKRGVGNAFGNAVAGAVSSAINGAVNGNAQRTASGIFGAQQTAAAPANPAFCPSCGNRITGGPKFCPSCGTPLARAAAPAQTSASSAAVTGSSPRVDMRSGLEALLQSELPGHTVRRGITADGLGWLPAGTRCVPYDYCIFGAGGMKGVITVTDHNRDNNTAFRNAKRAAQVAGVPFINFYTHMPNERDYVVNRIKTMLKA